LLSGAAFSFWRSGRANGAWSLQGGNIMPIALRSLAALLLAATVLTPARAQEVLLSRTGTAPAVATSGRGDFVIVWVDRQDILASVLPKGAPQPRAPFVVSQPGADPQVSPDVAMDAAGRFAVVWQDGLEDSGGARVLGEGFGAAGVRQSPEVPLSPTAAAEQITPQVAMLDDGSFVAAWVENRRPNPAIKAARFSAGGSPLGPEMEMKAGGFPIGDQVASFPGGFAVGWTQFYECSPGRYGYIGSVARFDLEGRRSGKIYSVGTSRCGSPDVSSLLALAGSRAGALAAFSESRRIAVQRFAPSGEPVGGSFSLPAPACTQDLCTALGAFAMDDAGRFAVVWQTLGHGQSSRLVAQLFNSRGKPLTGLVPVSDEPSSDLTPPAAALADDGTLAVVWRLVGAADPQRDGLILKRLRLPS
jgi:hypothetical protein